ncbi:MAG TPA: universal stress protein [Solirubrobacteraceae bacterium]|nr:universal stress protein [Solirubrobacteraceae bacterium]
MENQDPHSRSPIVAAFSPGTAAREPLEFGLAASRVTGAPLVIVAVRQGGPLVHSRGGDVVEGDDDRTLEHLRTGLSQRGLHDVEVREFEDNTAARGLARAVDELDPELIVLGSTRRGKVGSALLGTTAERVIHSSSCPVAVVPNGYEKPADGVKLIGAAYSDTDEGREALHAAAVLARAAGVKLRAITVLDPEHAGEGEGRMAEQHDELSPAVDEAARGRLGREQQLRDAVAEVAGDLDVDIDVLVNEPADGLVAASEQVDLLVMGSRGLGPKRAVVLGSVSRKVVDRAACPVLVLPRGASAKTDALLADAEAQAGTRP